MSLKHLLVSGHSEREMHRVNVYLHRLHYRLLFKKTMSLHRYIGIFIRQIKARRMRWAEHVERMGEDRKVYKVLVGKA
jgi:hypothetical protein